MLSNIIKPDIILKRILIKRFYNFQFDFTYQCKVVQLYMELVPGNSILEALLVLTQQKLI